MLKRVNEGIRHLPRRRKRVFLKNLKCKRYKIKLIYSTLEASWPVSITFSYFSAINISSPSTKHANRAGKLMCLLIFKIKNKNYKI